MKRIVLLLTLSALACGDDTHTPASALPSGTLPAATSECLPSSANDIEVSGADRDGFPPYALASCTLVYVNRAGDLVLRELATAREVTLAPANEKPRRPAVSAELIVWEAIEGERSVVRVRSRSSLDVRTLSGAFASAGEPRVSGTAVAFTAWAAIDPKSDTDVWVYNALTEQTTLLAGGPGQQRFADISATYVAVTDFAEDPDGRFDENETDIADVLLIERASGAKYTRKRPGKQAFPALGEGDALAYLDWGAVHPEPKLEAYDLRGARAHADVREDVAIAHVERDGGATTRPALAGGVLEWTARGGLWRAPVDGSSPPVLAQRFDNARTYAPVATAAGSARGFSVLATARYGATTSPTLLVGLSR
jgi:hypothetical protein